MTSFLRMMVSIGPGGFGNLRFSLLIPRPVGIGHKALIPLTIKTFQVVEGRISSSVMVNPTTISQAHRVLSRMPKLREGPVRILCLVRGTLRMRFLNSINGRMNLHYYTRPPHNSGKCKLPIDLLDIDSALLKWEISLNCTIPADIWTSTWLTFQGACENTFLWQLVYRVIARQHWRFPTRSALDPSTWCTRCPGRLRRDFMLANLEESK